MIEADLTPRTMENALEATADGAWLLDEDGRDKLRETSRETRFVISNGFLGVRGWQVVNRGAHWSVPPRTYVAGLFDSPGAAGAIPRLIPVADWLQVRILLTGGPVGHRAADLSCRHLTLDMRRGLVLTECDGSGAPVGARLRTLRLVSLSDRAIGLQLLRLEIEEATEITLEASFEGLHLGLKPERLDQDLGIWRTERSGKRLAMAAAVGLRIDGHELAATMAEPFKWSWTWTCRPGQVAYLERLVAVTRSDPATENPGEAAETKLAAARSIGWRGVLAAHEAAWRERWHQSDVTVEGDTPAQQALRFATYHLNSAANPADEHVSIGARALTGDDYLGHVFWDTEIFLLPFYTLTWPEAARALLMYRFRTLDGARAKAARLGWRGALYAWESADTGAEATPDQAVGPDRKIVPILCGTQEQHISADIAYAVWQYWQATGDEAFLLDAGAEILLETGRFWASRALPEADGTRHIRGVIGPDEYHEHIDDNAFTNVMARWNILRALEVAALLRERWPDRWASLSGRLALSDAELAEWSTAARTMAIGLDPRTGLFEQFAGYFALEPIDLAGYSGRSVPMDVVLGRERTQRSQVVKQADVVALLGLLPAEFPGDTGASNFRHYEPRCSHGSSLSRAMHGLVAARLGDTAMALDYFRQTAAIDLADTVVAIGGGVHIASQGGLWLIAVFGFAGVSLRSDGLALDPHLPTGWRRLRLRLQWRRRQLEISLDESGTIIDATLESGDPMPLFVRGEPHELRPNQTLRVVIARTPGPNRSTAETPRLNAAAPV